MDFAARSIYPILLHEVDDCKLGAALLHILHLLNSDSSASYPDISCSRRDFFKAGFTPTLALPYLKLPAISRGCHAGIDLTELTAERLPVVGRHYFPLS